MSEKSQKKRIDKKSKATILTSVIALAIVIIGVTYAYFSARITGLESASTISLTAGTMGIHYAEGNETVSVSNIYPKSDPWVTKTFTLTGNNTTAMPMEYEVGLQIITNTFKGGQLSFSLEVGNGNVGTSMAAVTNKAIVGSNRTMKIGSGSFPGPTTNGVQTYTLKIYFLENGKDQNINQGAVFNGKITVSEKVERQIANVPVNECTDTVHTTLAEGDEYVNGQYTYYYYDDEDSNLSGWGVYITNPSSTDPVTTSLCTSINGEPIINMGFMFSHSAATSIDLSSFDTSHVIDMSYMFSESEATALDLSSFDTSSVTNMEYMFSESEATALDLSSFNTSNVTNMSNMFSHSAATSINLSSFDTSNVTDMGGMFAEISVSSLDLSNFDTSNVTVMGGMFASTSVSSLDLSNFDTSEVTSMWVMFNNSTINTLNISSFNTSNVVYMSGMFWFGDIGTIDGLNVFDTSKVTDMSNMFTRSTTQSLDLSSFDTSGVTNMDYMFSQSASTTLDLSSFDTSHVTTMSFMFSTAAATAGYAKTQADADRFNNVAGSLSNGGNPNTYIPNTLTFTVK